MKSLEERIADRKARGKELAEQQAGDRKPTKEEIDAATTKTAVSTVLVTEGGAGKGAGKGADWKPNA